MLLLSLIIRVSCFCSIRLIISIRKIVKKTTKLYAHDEKGLAKKGDKVRVAETKPISKNKCWRLVEVLSH